MKSLRILMALLATGALSAQSATGELNGRVLLFEESIQTRSILLGQGIKDQADREAATGIRLMGQVGEESRWFWELSGRFAGSARMTTNRDISSTGTPNVLNATGVKIYYSYWSVGAAYLLPLSPSVDLGFHLEGRAETLNPKGDYSTTAGGTGYMDAHVVYGRPWVRLSLDVKFKTGSFTTLVGADAGVAATKTDQTRIMPLSEIDSTTMRSLAPTWSGAVYAGIQF